ncbi:MAG: O-antigen ligase family protein [Bacteroidota bacterium]
MILFPIIYIASFLYGAYLLLKKDIRGFPIFVIGGLPIYIQALSVTHLYGFASLIPFLQGCKEIIALGAFVMVIFTLQHRPKWHPVDKWMLVFLSATLLYLILPIGPYPFMSRLLAFKALSLFPLIYFTGRFCRATDINLNHLFSWICMVTLAAAAVLFFVEWLPYEHLHTKTGFMDFHIRFFNAEQSGNYGLFWTFETETGLKRFGSIFSSPLELAASTVLTLSVLLALAGDRFMHFRFTGFYTASLLATLFCIVLAVSRASLINYFILFYCFAHLTRQKKLIRFFHLSFVAAAILLVFVVKGDLLIFVIDTLRFQNASSIGHLLEWVNGLQAMASNPLGLGLGSSGRVAMETNDHVGGENQLIIIGVQAGIPVLLVYMYIYWLLLQTGYRGLYQSAGKQKRLVMAVLLLKIGMLIPLFTSYIDTFNYITYTINFLSGLMINVLMYQKEQSIPLVADKETTFLFK